jgi:hypothetical protein
MEAWQKVSPHLYSRTRDGLSGGETISPDVTDLEIHQKMLTEIFGIFAKIAPAFSTKQVNRTGLRMALLSILCALLDFYYLAVKGTVSSVFSCPIFLFRQLLLVPTGTSRNDFKFF